MAKASAGAGGVPAFPCAGGRQPAELPAFLNAIIAGLGGEVRCLACQMVLHRGQPRD